MGEVFRKGPYKVIVHSEEGQHLHSPHVHVRWGDNNEVVVSLRSGKIIRGQAPGREADIQELVWDNLPACREEWDRCHSRS